MSLDANFGLVRKTNSGTSAVEPKHSGKIFVEEAVNRELDMKLDNPINKRHVSIAPFF